MKCNYNDCFTCPYPDCILGDEVPYKKMTPEEFKEHRREYQRQYHLKRKAEHNKRHLEYYNEHKEEISLQRKKKRMEGLYESKT